MESIVAGYRRGPASRQHRVAHAGYARAAIAEGQAQLTEVVPQRRLTWHGNVGADWLFAGDRDFVIDQADDDAVNFTHVEDVRGVLFPLFRLLMGGRYPASP